MASEDAVRGESAKGAAAKDLELTLRIAGLRFSIDRGGTFTDVVVEVPPHLQRGGNGV
jgi:hypothetical protein